MRIEARIALVVVPLLILVVTLWPAADADRVAPERPPPSERIRVPDAGPDRAGRTAPRSPAAPPRPSPDDASPVQERSGLRRAAPRPRGFEAILLAAHRSPHAITPADLRRLWREAADRGAPEKAIEALVRIAAACVDRPALAHAALDAREDLVALRARATQAREEAVHGAAVPDAPAPETHADGVGLAERTPSAAQGADGIEPEHLAELAHVLRYGSDRREASAAIARLAILREPPVARSLLAAVDHPGADQRLASLTALWRMAADGDAPLERTRAALRRARHDTDPRIVRLAGQATRDLDARAEPAAGLLARAASGAAPPAPACPAEACGETRR